MKEEGVVSGWLRRIKVAGGDAGRPHLMAALGGGGGQDNARREDR